MNKAGNVCTVSPIRDINKLNDMKEYLFEHNRKIHLLFVLGINSGLRVSDLLKLTVEGVQGGSVTIREQKTSKAKQFELSNTCKKTIKEYLEYANITTGLLFPNKVGGDKPITKQWVWVMLNKAADWVGITENIGTHTMRKTFGYWAFKQGIDVYIIMQMLNHSSLAITKRYIGLTSDDLNKAYLDMNL